MKEQLKFANLAIVGIEEKDIQKAHTNIIKVERIIEEFQSTLDHKYPVAKDFDEVYSYLMIRLREANIKKGQRDYGRSVKTSAYHARHLERSDAYRQNTLIGEWYYGRQPVYYNHATKPSEEREGFKQHHTDQ